MGAPASRTRPVPRLVEHGRPDRATRRVSKRLDRSGRPTGVRTVPSRWGGPADREQSRERLAAALADDDGALLARLAVEAVDGFGGYGSSPGSDGWSSYRTLGRLRPQTLLARVRDRAAGAGRDARAGRDGGGRTGRRGRDRAAGFGDRLLEDEIRRRITEVQRRMVAAEARRRVAERRGRDEAA